MTASNPTRPPKSLSVKKAMSSLFSRRGIRFRFRGEVQSPDQVFDPRGLLPLVLMRALAVTPMFTRAGGGSAVIQDERALLGIAAEVPPYVGPDFGSLIFLAALESAAEEVMGLTPLQRDSEVVLDSLVDMSRSLPTPESPGGFEIPLQSGSAAGVDLASSVWQQ